MKIDVNKPLEFSALAWIAIENNPASVMAVLNASGYIPAAVKFTAPATPESKKRMLAYLNGIYIANKQNAINLLDKVQFDPNAKNWTTSIAFLTEMNKLLKK